MNDIYDLLIIGGGINGTGLAADAAGRGLKVLLSERGDLAEATSSASSKLIHGGLRYLEHYEFALVRKALHEREVLRKKAPHLIHPLKFIMPHDPSIRSFWLVRTGLFIYDHLISNNSFEKSRRVNLTHEPFSQQLVADFTKGFSYSDCLVDDARLVVANAIAAHEKGALILTRNEVVEALPHKTYWLVKIKDLLRKEISEFKTKVLVNASGPFANQVLKQLKIEERTILQLVKGSHILVKKLYEGNHAYILQHSDGRVIFVIPYEHQTLIGTTEINYRGDPALAAIEPEEISYLLHIVNHYFRRQIDKNDILWCYSGVRPLVDTKPNELSAISRDYKIQLQECADTAPLINVFGGKITTYRLLAEEVLKKLSKYFPSAQIPWTHESTLPGGDIPNANLKQFLLSLENEFYFLPVTLITRLGNSYGTRIYSLLKDIKSESDLGINFGNDLYEKEIEFLVKTEWALTLDDVLWRRTKLGLNFNFETTANLQNWFSKKF